MEWRKPEPKIFSVLCSFVGDANPTLHQYFFVCPVFRQLGVFFHFLTQLMGAFPLNRNLGTLFWSDFPAIERFGPRFSSHDLRLPKSRLAMQSSQIRTVRVHYADKLLESIEYERFQRFGKWVWVRNNHNARMLVSLLYFCLGWWLDL